MTDLNDTSRLPLDSTTLYIKLVDEAATTMCAAQLARVFPAGVVYLVGGLGAGKTTLTRAWLQAKGHQGSVKSPTYTLVEPYLIHNQSIYHFDLYRLNDPFELELMGIRDYVEDEDALLLIEWPQKGEPVIPSADLSLTLTVADDEVTRHLSLEAYSQRGFAAIQALEYDQNLRIIEPSNTMGLRDSPVDNHHV
ncbi:tRNA (adenosine(37)-N6)-threonylcarbamoyltransferase complex ATPase subunit type 1 TsaE [Aquirhabdus sp.]|uniref:tRNA (adenosine(37)-N6)-threonylcarbamoyltransferase complex ATPase subunit type 1 TsaE n=1 Tax=Aquirhabdus sp. TaxID=2824160 RepID=UPI00396C7538